MATGFKRAVFTTIQSRLRSLSRSGPCTQSAQSPWLLGICAHPDPLVLASPSAGPSTEAGLVAWRHSFSTAVASETPEPEGEPANAKFLYKRVSAAIEGGVAPERLLLRSLLERCRTPKDIEMALSAMHRLRIANAVKRNQLQNFPEEVAQTLVKACIEAGVAQRAMVALHKRNPYGLTPSLGAANLLLTHTLETGDLPLMQGVFRTMIFNDLRPSARSAEVILRTCEQHGQLKRLFKLAKEFNANSVPLPTGILDTLLTFAAAEGRSRDGLQMASVREQRQLPPTIQSSISVAKLHILEGNLEEAVTAVQSFTPSPEQQSEWESALRSMLEAWPMELPRRTDGTCRAMPLEDLKRRLHELAETLKARGVALPADINTESVAPSQQGDEK